MKKEKRFVLVAVPSVLISDKNIAEEFGIVLIKSPRAKRNFDPFLLLYDSSFCVENLDSDLLCLKQQHFDGYFVEICVYESIRWFFRRLFLLHFQWTFDCMSKV